MPEFVWFYNVNRKLLNFIVRNFARAWDKARHQIFKIFKIWYFLGFKIWLMKILWSRACYENFRRPPLQPFYWQTSPKGERWLGLSEPVFECRTSILPDFGREVYLVIKETAFRFQVVDRKLSQENSITMQVHNHSSVFWQNRYSCLSRAEKF